MDDSEKDAPPINKLPMEVWFEIINQIWQFDCDEDILNTFYGLRLTSQLASVIARRPLEKVLFERFFVGLLLPPWIDSSREGFYDPYALSMGRELERGLEDYVSSIQRLPRRFQSSAIFRTTPDLPTRTLTHDWRKSNLMLIHTNDWMLCGSIVKCFLKYIPEWSGGDAAFLFLLMLKQKCKHFNIKIIHDQEQLVFWRERWDWKDKHKKLIGDPARRKQGAYKTEQEKIAEQKHRKEEAYQIEQRALQYMIQQFFQPKYKEVQEREDWLRSNPPIKKMAFRPEQHLSELHAGRSVNTKELRLSHLDSSAHERLFDMLPEKEEKNEAHGKTRFGQDTKDGSDDLGLTICPEICDVCTIKWSWNISSG